MKTPDSFIKRKKKGTGIFQDLFQEGIDIIQKLSGDLWTDYNTHDPGVTLLENIIYGITELDYKSNFEVKDLLVNTLGTKLNSGGNALFESAAILTTNPVTIDDMRKIIIDQIPNVKNAWITPYKTSISDYSVFQLNGLYSISVEIESLPLSEGYEIEKEKLSKEVERVFYNNRNLCEDIYEIIIYDPYEITFELELSIEETVLGERVLAQVINEINAYLLQKVTFKTLWELEKEGFSTNEIFNGPRLKNGFIMDSSLKERRAEVHTLDIINIIGAVEGVISVISLKLLHQNPSNPAEFITLTLDKLLVPNQFFPTLRLPEKEGAVVFRSNGLKYKADLEEVLNELAYLDSMSYSSSMSGRKTPNDISIPQGNYLDIEEYHPIRFQLPDIYGVGENGLISDLPEIRYAQAKQLKSFLLPIDQVLMNMLASMRHLYDLYDVTEKNNASYFNSALPDIESTLELLDVNEKNKLKERIYEWRGKLAQLDNRFDTDSNERLQRITDDLLSRFSEAFPSYFLTKTYTEAYPFLNSESVNQKILSAKRNYIRNYDEISYNRNKACNYVELAKSIKNNLKPDETNKFLSGIVKKIALLTAIKNISIRAVSKEVYTSNVTVYGKSNDHEGLVQKLSAENVEEVFYRIKDYPSFLPSETNMGNAFYFTSSKNEVLKETLKKGIHQDNYFINSYQSKGRKIVQVWLSLEKTTKLVHVATNNTRALNHIKSCANVLRKVSEKSEAIFLIEHISLLPKTDEKNFAFSISLDAIDERIHLTIKNKEALSLQERDGILEQIFRGFDESELVFGVNAKDENYYMEVILNGKILAISQEVFPASKLDDLCKQVDLLLKCAKKITPDQVKKLVENHKKSIAFKNGMIEETFFSSKLSFVLPTWPVRFQDDNFKEILSNTVYDKIPIHLVADILWLTLNEMQEYEQLYFEWLESLTVNSSVEIDRTAYNFALFLSNQAKK